MKRKGYLFAFAALLALMSGCSLIIGPQVSQTQPSSSASESSDTSAEEEQKNWYIPETLRYTLRDVNSQAGWITSESVGNQKILVIPVQLKDGPEWNSTKLGYLNNTFFGEADTTKYESVRTYFEKSSYGQMHIDGSVTDPFVSAYTVADLNRLGDSAPDVVIAEFLKSANTSLLKEYDTDSDGCIDNAVLIYSNRYSSGSGSAFWAWCYAYAGTPSLIKPTIHNYMWASYYFMENAYLDGYRKSYADAHTYIHETGHLLGLDDYYSYDTTNAWDCAGELEMQAYNVGDHNIYSKMALGWVKPYVVTGPTEITLKTSASYPQAILINDNWNGSAFDEYILIEYYTPTGLNEVDMLHNFSARGTMYNYSGLRIYHVDARLARLRVNSYGGVTMVDYSDMIGNETDSIYYIAASNSYSYSYLSASQAKLYRYLHMIDSGGNNKLNGGNGGKVYSSFALWTEGKTFTPSGDYFAHDTKFNDGSEIGYSITVVDIDGENCTVRIDAING